MPFSIKHRLLFFFLLVVFLGGLFNAGAVYLTDRDRVRLQFDESLIHANLLYQTLLLAIPAKKLSTLQLALKSLPARQAMLYAASPGITKLLSDENSITQNTYYQILDQQNQIIVKTAEAPDTPLSNGLPGLSELTIRKQHWYIFTSKTIDGKFTVISAARYNTDSTIRASMLKHHIIFMLLSLPFVAFLVWVVLSISFRRLKKLSYEIGNRVPGYLTPLETTKLPAEIKSIITQLNKLFDLLQTALEQDKRFAADAAHELKTPLSAIKTQAQVAMRSNSPEKRQRALQQLISGVDRSAHIIDQLLSLTRATSHVSQDQQMRIDLVAIVKQTLMDLAPEAIGHDVELIFEPQEKHIDVIANPASMAIMSRNLIHNAINYIPRGCHVLIEIQTTDELVIFRVSDNGPGIPESLRQRVFERFFRVLGNEKPGTGLGLAIVKKIAQVHGASITLGSPKEGTGLVVEIRFPRYL